MEKLIENFMIEELRNNFKTFIKKELSGYDYVYLTSDLRGFLKKYYPVKAEELCNLLTSCLLKEDITILIPAYSYVGKGIFYVDKTNSNLSYFTKWALKLKKAYRTSHPIFSVCVLGKKWKIFKDIGKSAFGKNSIWDKLLKNKSSLLHFGRPFSLGNTMQHYVEQNVGANYRFHKTFKTKVFNKKKYIGKNFSAFVQNKKYNRNVKETNTKKISKLIMKQRFYKVIGYDDDLTNITHLDFKKTYEFMCKQFYKNNNIFISYK